MLCSAHGRVVGIYAAAADVLIAVDLPKETQAAAKELMARFNAK